MSLLAQTDPVMAFIQAGQRFIEAPGAISGMTFDDASVCLKTHVRTLEDNEDLTLMLNRLVPMIRQQDMEPLKSLFDEIRVLLEKE